MRTLDLEQMEQVSGTGFWGGTACSALTLGWGTVLAYGLATSVISAGASVAVGAVYGAVTLGVCSAVGYSEGI